MTAEEEKNLHEKINKVAIDVAAIKTKLEMLDRPCQWQTQLRKEFDQHIQSHQAVKSDWRQAAISGIIDLAKYVIFAGAGILIGYLVSGAGA